MRAEKHYTSQRDYEPARKRAMLRLRAAGFNPLHASALQRGILRRDAREPPRSASAKSGEPH